MGQREETVIRDKMSWWVEASSDYDIAQRLAETEDWRSVHGWRYHIKSFKEKFPDEVPKRADANELIPLHWDGSWKELARRLNKQSPDITVGAWEKRIENAKYRGAITQKSFTHFETVHLDSPEKDIEQLWKQVEDTTRESLLAHQDSRWAEVSFNKGGYIGVAFASDQHIGNSYTDHEQMRRDAELIAATDNLFVIHGGDFVDNFMVDKAKPAMRQRIPPSVQWKLAYHYLNLFDEKIVAVVAGNHDLWTSGLTDFDPLGQILKEKGILYHSNELNIKLLIGSQAYYVSVRHQRRGNSALHPARVVKKMREDGESDFDIGVIGHNHVPVIEPFTRHGRERWAIRPGSYKIIDGYGETLGFTRDRPTCPMVILSPTERSIQVFTELRDGVAALEALNDKC